MGELEVHALKDIDLAIKEGEFIVILGPSGSGKTTLLNLIGGMDTVSHGRLVVDGTDISDLDSRGLTEYRRTQIGFIFQFFNLIPTLTALENVEFALELVTEDTREGSMRALEMVGLSERAGHFPSQLSGGEQQRVAIARAICKEPPILLCDEPTGELDYETGKNVLKVMQEINRGNGQTVILVTHNSAIAEMADRTVRLHSGEVAGVVEVENPKDAADLVWQGGGAQGLPVQALVLPPGRRRTGPVTGGAGKRIRSGKGGFLPCTAAKGRPALSGQEVSPNLVPGRRSPAARRGRICAEADGDVFGYYRGPFACSPDRRSRRPSTPCTVMSATASSSTGVSGESTAMAIPSKPPSFMR